MTTTQVLLDLVHLTCNADGCGITFAVPKAWREARRDDHRTFYCPNGHDRWFPTGTSDLEKERKAREWAETRLGWAETREQAARDQADAAERSARAYRGHLTRLRNRIAAGVCPVPDCRRNFTNVKAHILNQHPHWAEEHAEALS